MSVFTERTFADALMLNVREQMETLVAEEAAEAARRVEQRARDLAPRLVMQLMKRFEIERHREAFVIRVLDSSEATHD